MSLQRVVIVGASIAGVHAAEALRDEKFDGTIILIDQQRGTPYDVPPRSKAFLLGTMTAEKLKLREPGWYGDNRITLRDGQAVRNVDCASKNVILSSGEAVPYDALLACTGSVATTPKALKDPDGRVHVLRSFDDAQRLRERLRPGSSLVVIGGGFIGLEVAAAGVAHGADVTVIEADEVPLRRALGTAAGDWFGKLHARHGVTIRTGVTVRSVSSIDDRIRVEVSSGDILAADEVVAGVGVLPATEWLSRSGIELTADGGVVCDAQLRTSEPGVWAAGDICDWDNELYGEHTRVEHWTTAVEQGQFAARSMLGISIGPYVSPPYFWTDQYDAKARSVGYPKGADVSMIARADDHSLVVLYGKSGTLRAALCVNALRALITCRQAVSAKLPWSEVPTLASRCA